MIRILNFIAHLPGIRWLLARSASRRQEAILLYSEIAERDKEIERLRRACAVLYWGSPELCHVAENEYSGCASTQRDDPYELQKTLEAGR